MRDWPTHGFPVPRALAGGERRPPLPPGNEVAPTAKPPSSAGGSDEAVMAATALAEATTTLPALADAIAGFDGCPLKAAARRTVVYDGVIGARLLIIGEGPGRDEDRIGKPFVGKAGGLLDLMLHAIGYSRTEADGRGDVLITNAVYWRPPGNRAPTGEEQAICLPFLRRFITLAAPEVIILMGNVSTQALYPGAPGITRTRGSWREWPLSDGRQAAVLPMFHPAFLLRAPAQKRLAWADLRAVAARLAAS